MLSFFSWQHRNLQLLVVMLLVCIYTVLTSLFALIPIDGSYSTILLTKVHYAAFTAVGGCFVSYFIAHRLFKPLLTSTLLLGLFNLINFLPATTSIGLRLGNVQLGIQLFSLLLLLVFYFLNRSSAHIFIRKHLLPAPTPHQAAQQYREAIDVFKQTFAHKTDENLHQILQDKKLVAPAIAAAQELLQERK